MSPEERGRIVAIVGTLVDEVGADEVLFALRVACVDRDLPPPVAAVAACPGCGASYQAEAFRALPLAGYQLDADEQPELELRHCPCVAHGPRFTLSVLVADLPADEPASGPIARAS